MIWSHGDRVQANQGCRLLHHGQTIDTHWIVVAWSYGATSHIVDYARLEVASEGWPVGTAAGNPMIPARVWIDSGYMTPMVYAFCRESGNRFLPAIGRGAAQQHRQWYNRPTHTGAIVRHIGEGFHINYIRAERIRLVEVDADHWKSWVHQRLSTPLDKPGTMTLFQAAPQEHLALAKHLTAETKTEEFVAGRGVVVKWERLRRQNHWFDALYNACAAGHLCGVGLVGLIRFARTKQHFPTRYPSLDSHARL